MKGLSIENLKVKVEDKEIIKNVNLTIEPGTIHALMGPNGSGKSTLAYAIMGREGYEIIDGKIYLDGEDITELPTEERALRGIFIGLQEPPAVPGLRFSSFLIALINKRLGEIDLFKLSSPKTLKRIYEVVEKVGLPREVLGREVNKGFSGGEKKRSEMAQALLVDPKIVILDEPDSGLDIDGVKRIAEIIKELRDQGKGILLITHYTRLLKYVKPDKISVIYQGRIIASGDESLAEIIDSQGYEGLIASLNK
ncbi:MAG: Fe-S cluster assembly ATPase SufC [Desulfurococcales archaeon]|nr:Fe-S cluster assembly ATPase SufC [Desulfurococcales archaeon]